METKKITAAAIFNLQHTQIKLWFTEKPSRTDELDEWLLQGVFYQFKDDLQAGKFMWLATSIFRKQASTSSFYDEITKIGVFIPDDMLRLIGIENDKVYLNAIPIKESDPEPNKNHIEESIKPGSSGTFCAEKLKPHSKINYLVVYYLRS